MKYITYNTQSDGAGSQLQRILNIYLIAKHFNLSYIHTPFHTTEHGFDSKLLHEFNQLIEIPSDTPLPEHYETIYIDNLNLNSIPFIEKEYPHPVLFKINIAHEYLNLHPEWLDPFFPHTFSWIQHQLDYNSFKIAIHIRRGDVSVSENSSRYIPFLFYLECIENLSRIFLEQHITHEFAIYSESSIYPELNEYQERLKLITNLKYHIDGDILQTFQELVNSDILVAGHSSLSFSAAMLKKKGVVIHLPFCCIYSQKHIEIHDSRQIFQNKTKIFDAIGF